jgi:hypothetical protein
MYLEEVRITTTARIYFFSLKVGWVRPKRGCLPLYEHIMHSPDDMSLESDGGMIY